MKNLYIVKIADGLGNQMFEYAWARTMQKLYGGKIIIDPHAFTSKQIRSLSLHNFCLNDNVISYPTFKDKVLIYLVGGYKKIVDFIYRGKTPRVYKMKAKLGIYEQISNFYYDSWIKPKLKINYFEGNWMAEYWFKPAENEIKFDFEIKTPPTAKSVELMEEMKSCNSVCIHIRLGDFMREPYNTMSRVCGNEYYNEAIRIIKLHVKDPVFYLFTNRPKDFEWIKKNYKFDADVKFVNYGNSDFEDLRLMTSCKHQIMSNSTFSWWAQYLNKNPQKVIVAPCMLNKHNKWDIKCLFMDDWHLVGPEYLNLEGMTSTADINSVSPFVNWEDVVKAANKKK